MSRNNRTPSEWLTEIEHGLEYRRRFGLEDLWGEFEAIYYNVHQTMLCDGPNIFLSQGDAMLSTLAVPEPRIKVSPTKPEELETAPIVEAIDNALLRDLDLATKVETAILHAWLFGRGILKFGYDSEWGYAPQFDVGGQLNLGLTFTQFDRKRENRIEYDSNVTPGSPWCDNVLPHDFILPWGVRELEHAPWVAHRVIRHIDDLKQDQKYSNTRNLQPNMSMEDFVNSYRTTMRMKSGRSVTTHTPEYIEMFEIHDRRSGRVRVITWDYDGFLRNEENSLQVDNQLPFASIAFTPRSRTFWTTPDVYYLYYIQNELADVARQRVKQRRISVVKFLADEGIISDEELGKIVSPDVGAIAKITAGGDITRAIHRVENVPNPMLGQDEDQLRANAREQIGFSRNQLGEYQGGRKTATEVQTVDRSSALRMSKRGLKVKRLYEDSLRLTNGIIFKYWTGQRYVEVVGEDGARTWEVYDGSTLRGRYSYNVEFTEAGELQARKLEALQVYSQLRQDPTINPQLLQQLVNSLIDDPRYRRLFNAQMGSGMQQVQEGGGSIPPDGTGN